MIANSKISENLKLSKGQVAVEYQERQRPGLFATFESEVYRLGKGYVTYSTEHHNSDNTFNNVRMTKAMRNALHALPEGDADIVMKSIKSALSNGEKEYLLRSILNEWETLFITRNDFQEINDARKLLNDMLDFEQHYMLLLEAYMDYHKFLNDIAMESSIFFIERVPWEHRNFRFAELFRHISLKVSSFLGLLYLIREQMRSPSKHYKDSFGKISPKKQLEKDMEGKTILFTKPLQKAKYLRHFAAHIEMPISRIVRSHRNVSSSTEYQSLTQIILTMNIDSLTSLNDYSEFVKLLDGAKEIDMTECINEAMQDIAQAHKQWQKIIQPEIENARDTIRHWINKYESNFPDSQHNGDVMLQVRYKGDELEQREIWIGLDWDDVRKSHAETLDRDAHFSDFVSKIGTWRIQPIFNNMSIAIAGRLTPKEKPFFVSEIEKRKGQLANRVRADTGILITATNQSTSKLVEAKKRDIRVVCKHQFKTLLQMSDPKDRSRKQEPPIYASQGSPAERGDKLLSHYNIN